MKQFDFLVKSPVGIHARPAMLLAKKAGNYQSEITVVKGNRSANVKNIVLLLGLHVNQGDKVSFIIDGQDEKIAAEELKQFCQLNL